MGEIDGLAATEQLLDATGAAVIHLRCGYFFTNLLFDLNAVRSGRFEVLLDVDHPFAWVAPRARRRGRRRVAAPRRLDRPPSSGGPRRGERRETLEGGCVNSIWPHGDGLIWPHLARGAWSQ